MLAPRIVSMPLINLQAGRVASAMLIAALISRLVIEAVWLLPSPVADSTFFLTASVNYCRSGFLGTTAFPIDPTGHSRMVWHGFVSPMFFGVLNPGCHPAIFYLTLWTIKASTVGAILLLSRGRTYSVFTAAALATFTLAAQTFIAFRPECLAILLIVWAELAFDAEQPVLLGAIMGSLLCTQPTVAGLHGLALLAARPALVRKWMQIGVGYAVAGATLLAIYPFSLPDLIQGILLQAKHLVGRNDGGVLSYYLLSPQLPGWSVLLVAAGIVVTRRRPLLMLMLPVFWFFGPRVPPTFYNLIPSCVLLLLIACGWSSQRVTNALGTGCLIVGVMGLTFVTARDTLTIVSYGDTFQSTRSEVKQWEALGTTIDVAPAFLSLTNPELGITDPNAPKHAQTALGNSIDLYAVNGRPISPCGTGQPGPRVALSIGDSKLFNSNSGWMVFVCRSPT
jgi:hypothetical protein